MIRTLGADDVFGVFGDMAIVDSAPRSATRDWFVAAYLCAPPTPGTRSGQGTNRTDSHD